MSPVSYAPTSPRGPATAPTGTPETVLVTLLHRAHAAGLTVDAALTAPSGSERAFAAAKRPRALWLTEHITAPAPGPAGMGALWRAMMLAGALRDALHWEGGPPLAGVRIEVTDLNDRHTEEVGDGELSGAAGQFFSSQSEARARATVLVRAAAAKLTVSSLHVTTLLQPAVEVVVRVPAAARWIKSHSVEQLLFGSGTTRFEGVHVEVDDAASGRPVYASAWAYRTANSYGWTPGRPPELTRVRTVVVPGATPNELDVAVRKLRARGLRPLLQSLPPLVAADLGTNGYAAVSERPRAGTRVAVGSSVLLRISISENGGRGGLARSGRVRVPNLTGVDIEQAIRSALRSGLRVTVPAVHHRVRDFRVRYQSLRRSRIVRAGAIITLVIDRS